MTARSGSTPEPDERALVRMLAAALGDPDLSDDCAHLDGTTALVTTDALVEGVHFDLSRDTPAQVGAQAAVQNLSDLAASGGAAGWLVWSLMLPPGFTDVEDLARGFGDTARAHGARVVGGNLSRTDGPLTLAVTAGGPLAGARPFRRDGARPGDGVYLTGHVGDAALGVAEPDAEARAARHRWRPHLLEARALAAWGGVSAALDVSDGLLRDTARLAEASGVGVELDSTRVPVSDLYRIRRSNLELALGGGEDYVLLFAAAGDPPLGVRVGTCTAAPGLRLDGRPAPPRGFDHFGA